jgi:hypothetical protein
VIYVKGFFLKRLLRTEISVSHYESDVLVLDQSL